MIPARKFPLGEKLVWRLIDGSLRKYFDRVLFRMHTERTEEQRALPQIVCANHAVAISYKVQQEIEHLRLYRNQFQSPSQFMPVGVK